MFSGSIYAYYNIIYKNLTNSSINAAQIILDANDYLRYRIMYKTLKNMWTSGAFETLHTQINTSAVTFFEKPFFLVDFCYTCFFSGVDFIYTYSLNNFFTELKIFFRNCLCMLFEDNYTAYYDLLLNSTLLLDSNLIMYTAILETYLQNATNLVASQYYNDAATLIICNSLLTIDNAPMLHSWLNLNETQNNLLSNGNYDFALLLNYADESFVSSTLGFVQALVFVYFMLIIAGFYIFNFEPDTKKSKTINVEALIQQSLTLNEEEIGALEDKIFYYLFFIAFLGWLFFHSFFILLTNRPALFVLLWFAPIIVLVIGVIPINFLYNFSISFLSYLRGAATTNHAWNEFLFDSIIGLALFIRFFVQGVRLLLIVFVYISFHDLFILNDWIQFNIYDNEFIFDSLKVSEDTYNTSGFFIALKLFFWVWYLIYETGHVFFVFLAQHFAFFAMIFWLFFFFSTCFTFDAIEEFADELKANSVALGRKKFNETTITPNASEITYYSEFF